MEHPGILSQLHSKIICSILALNFFLNFSWKFLVQLFPMLTCILYWALFSWEWYLCASFQLSFSKKLCQRSHSGGRVDSISQAICWQSNVTESCILLSFFFKLTHNKMHFLSSTRRKIFWIRSKKVKTNRYINIFPLENQISLKMTNFFSSR